MAEAVEKALDQEHHLFVEAGTGTGKTLAYLVPAVLSGRKVVISTATRALQKAGFTREGLPHTEQLHLTEKFTRPEYDTLRYEVTVDDPGAYTKPWSGGWAIPWSNTSDEMYEYMCQENNRDVKHMYGGTE